MYSGKAPTRDDNTRPPTSRISLLYMRLPRSADTSPAMTGEPHTLKMLLLIVLPFCAGLPYNLKQTLIEEYFLFADFL